MRRHPRGRRHRTRPEPDQLIDIFLSEADDDLIVGELSRVPAPELLKAAVAAIRMVQDDRQVLLSDLADADAQGNHGIGL